LGFNKQTGHREAARCLNCDVQTVFDFSTCIECDSCVDVCPESCINFVANGDEEDLRQRLLVPADNPQQALYVSDPAAHRPGHGQRRERLPALRALRRALPDLVLGDDEIYLQLTAGTTKMNKIEVSTTLSSVLPTSTAPVRPAPTTSLPRPSSAWGCRSAQRTSSPPTSRACRPGTRCESSEQGYLGRRGGYDLAVAVNGQTLLRGLSRAGPRRVLFLRLHPGLSGDFDRATMTLLPVPLTELCNAAFDHPKLRQLLKNIIYVGAWPRSSTWNSRCSPKRWNSSCKKSKTGGPQHQGPRTRLWLRPRPPHRDVPFRCARRDNIGDQVLIDGNTAFALGALYGGATVVGWYPITPSTSVVEAFEKYCRKFRIEDDGGDARSPFFRPRTNWRHWASSSAPPGTAPAPSPPPPARAFR
jgi:ferredoxin